ncbi:MAG TPA: LysR family transcriptional regulator [Methylomusa anaerophila]|uniref:HTH-type transcriptional regulator YofA n=1 Tax=Methylomusa anaerophila TaxID=1930071 RepID=A0A348AHL0_9FIRM|nr:LysR family transcriptional regulator [Methylomusa anaerophila]BBB90558.1 HTH-type transcriptional regulator YofA [Methylomusa anaerophila]HML88836.1 LysR family transcriptional regulator [Methylomusa anaerophila]
MELRQLKTFVMIVRLRSFTKASDVLNYAQSTVTSQIQSLEEELGTLLFERIGRQVQLTKDGESLLLYAEQIVKLADAAKDVLTTSSHPQGTLRIGTPESFCLNRLPELIKDYRWRYPEVEIKLSFGICCDFLKSVRNNNVDLAFFYDEILEDSDLVVHVLYDEPVLILASPQHPLVQKKRITFQDLNGQSLILTESGCRYRARFEKAMSNAKVQPCTTLEISSVEVQKRFTMDNQGLAVLSKTAVDNELAQGLLTALPWAGPSFDVKVQLVYHKDKWLSPALKAFIDLACCTLGNKPRLLRSGF